MSNELPSELKDARLLLEKAINHSEHKLRSMFFEKAIDILDEFTSDYPETSHKQYIEMLKLTYTKKLIEGLSSFQIPDINVFVGYVVIFDKKVKNEFEICKKNHSLNSIYEDFLKYFGSFIEP